MLWSGVGGHEGIRVRWEVEVGLDLGVVGGYGIA